MTHQDLTGQDVSPKFTPLPEIVTSGRYAGRFYSLLDRRENGCWTRAGATPGKYWRVRLPGTRKLFQASRVSYALRHGIDPGDKLICHTCDNPVCCNPDHLFLGTARDNARDMIAKGRGKNGRANRRVCNFDLSGWDDYSLHVAQGKAEALPKEARND